MHGTGASLNRVALSATAHCLTGCAIGEVPGSVIGTALGRGDAAPRSRWRWRWRSFSATRLRCCRSCDPAWRSGRCCRWSWPRTRSLSIAVMEAVDDAAMLVIPGAMEAGLWSALFWGSLAFALAVAFAAAFPVNRRLIARGRGHAVVHRYHGGHGEGREHHEH